MYQFGQQTSPIFKLLPWLFKRRKVINCSAKRTIYVILDIQNVFFVQFWIGFCFNVSR